MFYVYLLHSQAQPGQRYIGLTGNLRERLASHNRCENRHTAKYAPWQLVTYLAFSDEGQAKSFEQYLKSGSGFAFANKRLWPR